MPLVTQAFLAAVSAPGVTATAAAALTVPAAAAAAAITTNQQRKQQHAAPRRIPALWPAPHFDVSSIAVAQPRFASTAALLQAVPQQYRRMPAAAAAADGDPLPVTTGAALFGRSTPVAPAHGFITTG